MVIVAEMLFLVIIMALVNGVATLALQELHLSARLFSVFVVLFLTTVGVQVWRTSRGAVTFMIG